MNRDDRHPAAVWLGNALPRNETAPNRSHRERPRRGYKIRFGTNGLAGLAGGAVGLRSFGAALGVLLGGLFGAAAGAAGGGLCKGKASGAEDERHAEHQAHDLLHFVYFSLRL
jgi:hypothetical protein